MATLAVFGLKVLGSMRITSFSINSKRPITKVGSFIQGRPSPPLSIDFATELASDANELKGYDDDDDDAPYDRLPAMPYFVERQVREEAGLDISKPLHLDRSGPYWTLMEAVERRREWVDSGNYSEADLGVFSEEMSTTGARRFFVDTFAGFAIRHSTLDYEGSSFYEVIQESRPCWLYFDLEYSKRTVLNTKPSAVMKFFEDKLKQYFLDTFQEDLHESSIIQLDSSSEDKFSRHVIVKGRALQSYVQAGMVAKGFVDYVSKLPGDNHLLAPTEDGQKVSVVDLSVYTRNRCFRLLFQSKLGKNRTLQLLSTDGPTHDHDERAVQLLQTMASFVPEAHHHVFDEGSQTLSLSALAPGMLQQQTTHAQVRSPAETRKWEPLGEWLVEQWDRVRSGMEPSARHHCSKLRLISFQGDGVFFGVDHNRYCCIRGRSHKSNGIFFVVDRETNTWRQYCHDCDCKLQRKTFFARQPAKHCPAELIPD